MHVRVDERVGNRREMLRRITWIAAFAWVAAAPSIAGAQAGGLRPPSILGGGESAFAEEEESEAAGDKEAVPDLEVPAELIGAPVVRVDVTGNKRSGADDIRANIGTRQGMKFDVARVGRDIKSLHQLGLFSDVSASVAAEGDGVVVTYNVTEKAAVAEVKYGATTRSMRTTSRRSSTSRPTGRSTSRRFTRTSRRSATCIRRRASSSPRSRTASTRLWVRTTTTSRS